MDDGSGNHRPVQCGRRTSEQRHQKDTSAEKALYDSKGEI